MRLVKVGLVLLVIGNCVLAATIRVPQDQGTIQAGINAAMDGDTVLVGPGVYDGFSSVHGKRLVIRSELGPDSTTLNSADSCLELTDCGPGNEISGMQFTGANNYCIRIVNSDTVRVSECIFKDNNGVEVWSDQSKVLVTGNQFYPWIGRSDYCVFVHDYSEAFVSRNLFANGASQPTVSVYVDSKCDLINNTFYNCWTGVAYQDGSLGSARNNIFFGLGNYAFYVEEADVMVHYSDFIANGSDIQPTTSNGVGNLFVDPLLSDPSSGDFSLEMTSQCIDSGDPSPEYNDPDGTRNDMGAYPYWQHIGGVLVVPSDYPTIQAALDASFDGDTVIVQPGTYSGPGNRDLDFSGKSVLLQSVTGPANTIIDCGGSVFEPHRGIRFSSGEGSTSIVRGFTIMNGRGLFDAGDPAYSFGGAILCLGSSPTIDSCILTYSYADVGGAFCAKDGGSPTVINSVIMGDSATWGGGINVLFASGRFRNLRIIDNAASEGGAAIDMNSGSPEFTDCLVAENRSGQKAAIVCFDLSAPEFSNCTIAMNSGLQAGGVYLESQNSVQVLFNNCLVAFQRAGKAFKRSSEDPTVLLTCGNIFGNAGGDWIDFIADQLGQSGNISVDPILCDTTSGDYSIGSSSPCAPANNSCGVLIGTYGVGCENAPPVLTSESDLTIVKRVPFTYIVTSEDSDGPSASYSFMNLPSWLDSADDSCFGTPQLEDSDTSFTVVVSDGFLADTMVVTLHLLETPVVAGIAVDGESEPLHVVSAAPLIAWDYADTAGLYPQTALEIGVGTDNDWQYAEMWNPAPVASADTFVVYGGALLIDGQTYWLRLRVSNSLGWSNWAELMFRMNSVPSVPELVAPANGGTVTSPQPSLTIRRVSDAEGDSLLLTFEITNDSSFAFFVSFTAQPGGDSLTTVHVPFYLTEDQHYWWRVKASDYYEESAYSAIWSFWLNSENSAPTPFALLSPPNGLTPALTTTTPILQWTRSRDFDPFDSVRYELHLALYPNFSFATIIAGITDTTYQIGEPLSWGTNYWWKVKATDLSTGVTWSNQVFSFRVMKIGDPDGNGQISISDAVFLINYIFAGGPAPVPLLSGDADCSGAISISDAVYLINYIFAAGPAPCEP